MALAAFKDNALIIILQSKWNNVLTHIFALEDSYTFYSGTTIKYYLLLCNVFCFVKVLLFIGSRHMISPVF